MQEPQNSWKENFNPETNDMLWSISSIKQVLVVPEGLCSHFP